MNYGPEFIYYYTCYYEYEVIDYYYCNVYQYSAAHSIGMQCYLDHKIACSSEA